MSELIAEARVLVTPDTTKFRSLLTAELATATRGVTVPVQVAPVVTRASAGAAAATAAAQRELLGASEASVAAALAQQNAIARVLAEQLRGAAAAAESAAATKQDTLARRENAAAAAAQQRNLGNATRGATSAALSFLGLRGATLAAGGAFLAGAAGVVAFGKALGSAAKFQTSLSVFAATTGATADQMERISAVSKELGADLTLPGVTANSAADALSGLARAGLSVDESIKGVRGVLQLATAAAIDNEDAVNIVAGALNAFSLSGEKAAQVADLLAASSKESQGEITDVGLALQQSAAAAAQAGVSVQDTIALLTELGRAGLRGSDAGTSLRVALLRLIAPTKQAKEALEGLGVQIRDQAGNVRPEAFVEITEALNGFSKAQRDATLALIFGQDAFRAASIIGREGAKGLSEMRDATQEVGVAAELAGARTKGLAGSAENLKNQVSTLGLAIGQGLSTPTQDFVDIIAGGIENINSFIGFLDRLGGDSAPRAEQSISDLADEFARLNKEAGGPGSAAAARQRVEDLGKPAAAAVLDYAELTRELGRLSFAFDTLREKGNSLDTPGAKKLAEDIADLKDRLLETEPAGLAAASGIEAFRSGITSTAIELERLKHAISPPEGFLPKTPVAPDTGPKPIGPEAKLDVAIQVAQSNNDLQEVLRLQQIKLANARKAFAASHGNVEQRTALFKAIGDAEAAVNATRRQIASQATADAAKTAAAEKTAAAKQAQAKAAADQVFLDTQENARAAKQRLVGLAEESDSLKDDIQRRQELRTLITQQIVALRQSAVDEQTKAAAIKVLVAAKQQTSDEINKLTREQTAQNKTQREAAQEERESAQIALGESILDLTGNKNPLLRAIDAAIKDAIRERNAAKKGSLAFIQAQTEINQLLKRRQDLLTSAAKASEKSFSGFEFLQKTQGFAANLLGNLIPGFATGGLVGNTSAVQAQITDPTLGAGIERTVGLGSVSDRGVRPVQVDTTNMLLRQILAALNGSQAQPIEVKRNRFTSDAVMDTI